jgi:hypothetical protein
VYTSGNGRFTMLVPPGRYKLRARFLDRTVPVDFHKFAFGFRQVVVTPGRVAQADVVVDLYIP